MQTTGATPLELELRDTLRWIESQGCSEEATRASAAVSAAIAVLQYIRYANPGGSTKWGLDGQLNLQDPANQLTRSAGRV